MACILLVSPKTWVVLVSMMASWLLITVTSFTEIPSNLPCQKPWNTLLLRLNQSIILYTDLFGDRHISERALVESLVCPAKKELRTCPSEVETEHWSGNLALQYKGLKRGNAPVNRHGRVCQAKNTVRKVCIAGLVRGRTDFLKSSLAEKFVSNQNIRAKN